MSYNGCKIRDYSRINPDTGAGFILQRLYDLENVEGATKKTVYSDTHYERRIGPGYHSSIWAKLLEDGLIAPWDGFVDFKIPDSYLHHDYNRRGCRAKGNGAGKNYAVRYFITELGRQTLAKMNERLAKIREDKQEFCKRNSIQFGTGKTLNKELPTVDEFDKAFPGIGLLKVDDGKAALDKLDHFDLGLASKLDDVIRELQEIRASL